MWANRAHGMTYDRKTTGKKDNRIMQASRANGMTYDRTERQENRIATWESRAHGMTQDIQKDHRIQRQQGRKITGQEENSTERQQDRLTQTTAQEENRAERNI